ncbi:molecular chaperone [Microcystis phage Mae-JY30]
MTHPYPLAWPPHIPRWKGVRDNGQFRTSLPSAMDNVETSLRLFARDSGEVIKGVVLSSNVTLGQNRPDDPGVAVWFEWDEMQVCIPVDRYGKVEANLQAIHLILEARRVELRHGTLALVRASLAGFSALPAPGAKKPWREVLELDRPAVTARDIESRFKAFAKQRHPDMPGGSAEKMAELNAARDEALREIGQ